MNLMNRSELAEAFAVNLCTIDAWTRKGMPGTKRGRQWQFDLEEVRLWRYRQQGFQNPDNFVIREYTARIIRDVFVWLTNEAGPAWSGMMNEIGINDSKFIRKLYVLTFIIMRFSVDQLIQSELGQQHISIELPEIIKKILEEDTDIRNAVVKFCQDKK